MLTGLIEEQAKWIMQACEELGGISQSDIYLDRRYLTEQHKLANALVEKWMRQNQMKTWQDEAGNIWGRHQTDVKHAKTMVLGSHLDTVVNGGKYDGMLGVVLPIALIRLLIFLDISLPFNIDIVGFGDEEGSRFGTTLLGSRALTGKWQKEWADFKDKNNVTMRQAMKDFGLNFDKIENCKLTSETLLAYIETHIEQGPVLEDRQMPVGVVTAIAGAKRLVVTIRGVAGHAGTVPMLHRQDSLAGASEMILAIETCAKQTDVVATVGKITTYPDAVNVISGHTEFSIDIRSDDDRTRDFCLDKIMRQMNHIAIKRGLVIDTKITHEAPSIKCSEVLVEKLCNACLNYSGIPKNKELKLFSGAGHDAMAMAEICDVGMLFVRCKKGISHHPDESIDIEDVKSALNVMFHFINSFNRT